MTKEIKFWIHCTIMLVLTFGIGLFPPLGGDITPFGMKILGVFIGLIYGWSTLGFFWTSCFGMVALGIAGYDNMTNILIQGFGNTTTLQTIMLFLLVAYFIESGLVQLVTSWFMTRKVAQGRPYLLIFLILLGCGIVSMLGLGFGGMFFVWAILYQIFDLLGYKKGDLLVTFLIFGAAIICSLANSVLPFSVFANMFKGFLVSVDYQMPDIPWLCWSFIYAIVLLAVYVLFGKLVLRLNVKPFIDNADKVNSVFKKQPLTIYQKIAIGCLIMFLIVTLLPSFLPETSSVRLFLAQFGMMGATMLVVAVTAVIKINGDSITDWSKNAASGMNWELVMMFAASAPLASALESEEAGILTTVMAFIMPYINGMSPFVFTIFVLAIILLLTQFVHNVVVMIALGPTILAIADSMGINCGLLAAGICVVAQAAFLTPGASVTAAAVFGNSEYVSVKQAYFIGSFAVILSAIVIAIVYPLGTIMF